MHKLIHFLPCLLALFCMQSCELLENPAPREKPKGTSYTDYSSIPDSKKQTLFIEIFSDNNKGWSLSYPNTLSYCGVNSGALNIQSNFAGESLSTIDVNYFSGNINFEIQISARSEPNSYDLGNKIIWGYNAGTKQYNFLKINNYNSKVSIGRYDGNNEFNQMPTGGISSLYNRNSYNTYIIRKVGNQYYYFLNGFFIHQETFNDFKGSRIGFQTSQYGEIYVDYLVINKLNL